MTITAATMQKDVYKEFHSRAYHPEVSEVYANYTSRSGKLSNVENNDKVAFVGLQYFIKSYLQEEWADFFAMDKESAVKNHRRIMSAMLGYSVNVKYLEDLHDLGYLPLRIKALPEGSLVPYLVPPITVVNTKEGFQWLTNMIETVLSCENWPIQTSATTSVAYLKVFKEFANKTGLPLDMVPFQGHDFSFRGMFGKQAAAMSGFGHLASGLVGTDTIPAVLFAEKYYAANVDEELVGCSVDATEHSVTCSWIMEGEIEFFQYLMREQSPTGILSVVSDTWDFWTLVTDYLPQLKDEIMARDGTLVIRPDSGDPVKILTGYTTSPVSDYSELFATQKEAEQDVIEKGYEAYRWHGKYFSFEDENTIALMDCEVKGLIECLWDIFGGTMTDKGYKLLDEHVGAIYGDAITLIRQRQILQRLMDKGFASKVVLGIGSYSYQYVTRDTHGSAVKATSVVKNGERVAIFKDPKTDTKKKSAKGLLKVENIDGELTLFDDVSEQEEKEGLLETVFEDGKLVKETTLKQIRALISEQI
ncbi:nicotinate phosphoribosyltransferase [Vibrio azureus]|uniref:Nicotinamide phosphoribosyltransferase n=1 Tax=Vibrio azureus NBRC 104587 TaxID=1219077 RepID=U3C5C3_9VIBR|nr:nicotinate phosphoribosyltransferase [Vibrio azureus]AUI87729.1 nicotinate phosphoribosyltransferase [Vibrio azureus]GAD76619.1 nicotinamide phosphoribosyltransferase [Vibrio azureus NBRC 104587]